MEKNFRAKPAQAWAVKGWVTLTTKEEGHGTGVEKDSRVKHAQTWAMTGMGDLLGGKMRVLVPVDHRFRVINLCYV